MAPDAPREGRIVTLDGSIDLTRVGLERADNNRGRRILVAIA